jgi:hypothetical protein
MACEGSSFRENRMKHKIFDLKRGTLLALLFVALVAGCGVPAPGGETPARPSTEEQAIVQPAATFTPYPTYTPYPTHTPYPTYTPYPTDVPLSTATPAVEPTAMPTGVPTEASTAVPDGSQALPAPASAPVTSGAVDVTLERIPDTDPGPPVAILVDTMRIQEDGKYRVTGRVRNDGSETYEGVGVHGSFLDKAGMGHGPVDVYSPCPFLEPGAACPFSLEIYSRDYVAYHLHPLGQPVVYRQPAPIVLSGLVVLNDGVGYVRITGTATNRNAFVVRDPTIAGALVDSSGRIVSVGSTSVLGDVAPGTSVSFDVRVKYAPYSTYKLYAQATQN